MAAKRGKATLESLALHPRSLVDVAEAGRQIGLDVVYQPRFMWVAEEMLCASLPQGWVEHLDDASGCKYWYNEGTNESVWSHPRTDEFAAVLEEAIAVDRKAGRKAAVGIAFRKIPKEHTGVPPSEDAKRALKMSNSKSTSSAASPKHAVAGVGYSPADVLEYAQNLGVRIGPGVAPQESESRCVRHVTGYMAAYASGRLPEQWVVHEDAEGNPYYYNWQTEESTYDNPSEAFAKAQIEAERASGSCGGGRLEQWHVFRNTGAGDIAKSKVAYHNFKTGETRATAPSLGMEITIMAQRLIRRAIARRRVRLLREKRADPAADGDSQQRLSRAIQGVNRKQLRRTASNRDSMIKHERIVGEEAERQLKQLRAENHERERQAVQRRQEEEAGMRQAEAFQRKNGDAFWGIDAAAAMDQDQASRAKAQREAAAAEAEADEVRKESTRRGTAQRSARNKELMKKRAERRQALQIQNLKVARLEAAALRGVEAEQRACGDRFWGIEAIEKKAHALLEAKKRAVEAAKQAKVDNFYQNWRDKGAQARRSQKMTNEARRQALRHNYMDSFWKAKSSKVVAEHEHKYEKHGATEAHTPLKTVFKAPLGFPIEVKPTGAQIFHKLTLGTKGRRAPVAVHKERSGYFYLPNLQHVSKAARRRIRRLDKEASLAATLRRCQTALPGQRPPTGSRGSLKGARARMISKRRIRTAPAGGRTGGRPGTSKSVKSRKGGYQWGSIPKARARTPSFSALSPAQIADIPVVKTTSSGATIWVNRSSAYQAMDEPQSASPRPRVAKAIGSFNVERIKQQTGDLQRSGRLNVSRVSGRTKSKKKGKKKKKKTTGRFSWT